MLAVKSVIVAAPFSNERPLANDISKLFISSDFFYLHRYNKNYLMTALR